MPLFLGAHTIDTGGIHMAARRAGKAKMKALQVFTAVPKYYNEKIGVKPERAERFRAALADAKIDGAHVMAHAAYVLTVATPDEAKWERAAAGLAKEVERAATLGIGAVCFHPGSAGAGGDRDEAIERVATAVTRAIVDAPEGTRLLVENTAGAGATIGRTAAEVAGVLALVPKKLRPRTGYGLDTCHLFASGHPIHESRTALRDVLDEFEDRCGEPPSFFHLNDSEGEFDSNRDRHRLIGEGRIGTEPFGWLLHDRRAKDVPLVLETPQSSEPEDDDDTPDEHDMRMMKLLTGLAKKAVR